MIRAEITSRAGVGRVLAAFASCGAVASVAVLLLQFSGRSQSIHDLGGFATSLAPRTGSQRFNASRAAEALDGTVIEPGAVFSFNEAVRSWTLDRGYVKAPVSYDGELVKQYGGGVCQTSSTLYNAALLAGMPIVERHSHVFAPHYVAPGRDAAVAQRNIDLRFANPYPWPVRIRASARHARIEIHLIGARKPSDTVSVVTDLISVTRPQRLTRVFHDRDGMAGRSYVRNPGAAGYRVVTYRVFLRNGREVRREEVSDDTYQAMDRIVQMVD